MKDTKRIIIGNWKMNPQSKKEAEVIFRGISKINKNIKNTEVVICPSFPHFFIKGKTKDKKIKLGSQDVFFEKEGSYTGEISTGMLRDFNVDYVLVGHSERRSLGDTNEIVNKKIIELLKYKIIPVFCIGESDRDHNGFYLSFLKNQIESGLININKNQIRSIIIAYEPIWAIGSSATRVATPEEFNEIRIYIKKVLSDIYGAKLANEIKIIYGGSVNPLNAKEFLKEGEADGLLVGRDSLNPKKFGDIIITASK